MTVVPIPLLVQYNAKQIRQVLAAGQVQYVDGSQEQFLVTPQGQTFIPTTANGNVVPVNGQWVIWARPNPQVALPGVGYQPNPPINNPNGGVPVPFGPFSVLTEAQFEAAYQAL